MGLTSSSTGSNLLSEDLKQIQDNSDFTVAFAGNPNVGKSTIFNSLTGLHQHTGNWPGKTVANASGTCNYKNKNFLLIDIPGTYSLMSNSQEEEIARDYICFGKPDATVVVVDATCLERNLNLVFQTMEITSNIIVCVNLLDDAKKKNIKVDLKKLEELLGVPVVGTIARKEKTLNKLLEKIDLVCSKKIISKPKQIQYLPIIEDSILTLNSEIDKITNKDFKYINRWICLKLLDNDDKIINSIENSLNISLHSQSIVDKLDTIRKNLKKNDLDFSSIKDSIVSSIMKKSEKVLLDVCTFGDYNYNRRTRKVDKILTSKIFGIPIMIAFLAVLFWLTIVGANYPSMLLSTFFNFIQDKLLVLFDILNIPTFITELLINGMYKTVAWVVSVMLPPMAIFFPLFTLLEDLGYLPRIAFNLDNYFKKAGTSGKQALTMCMGFGCNAAGVVGCRIIDSPRERIISMLTNAFVPCNGRFPLLITISAIFIGSYFTGSASSVVSTICVLLVVLLGIFLTLFISKILSKTILKGVPSSFILELPPYRKPQIGSIIVRSLLDRTLFVLGRAVSIAAPIGIVIWLFANIHISECSILFYIANFLDPFAKLMGLDGYILTAFILGIPANEIVLPIILMSYLSSGSLVNVDNTFAIGEILRQNGWTLLTGINVMIFTLLHFPCGTTLMSIKKESGSFKWAILAFALPTFCGIVLCMITTLIFNLVLL